MVFDLRSPVGDVAWAPYSSTTFGLVTEEGKVHVYDLAVNRRDALCEQKVTKKAKATRLAFNPRRHLLLVGDDAGVVVSLRLSPNLRALTPIPLPVVQKAETPPPTPSREAVEIRKLDALLERSDARISIVTPVPGEGVRGNAAGAGGQGARGEGDGEDGAGGRDSAAAAEAAT